METTCNRIETGEKHTFRDRKTAWINDDDVNEKVKNIMLGYSICDCIIKAFIDRMPIRNSDDDAYIECFLNGLGEKYFNLYMVDKLIQKHLGYMIFKIFYKFKFEDYEEIAEKLINAGYTGENIKIFKKEQ